jgi:Holin of 3TMs, for gene-transfer release
MFSLLSLISLLVKGPLSTIIDAYVADVELRRKLKADLEASLLDHLAKSEELQQNIVLAEIKSSQWLTANWRPILMLVLMGFLVLVGLVIPTLDWIAGHPIPYQPRWNDLPAGFWDFLTVGVGGYIGGRSLEKISTQVFGAVKGKK